MARVKQIEEARVSEVPDNADAIACAAASSLADIGRAKGELSLGTEDGWEDLLEANISK